MQTIDHLKNLNIPSSNPGVQAGSQSGFAPVPKRIQNVPPLVTGPQSESMSAEVSDTLDELAQKLAVIHITATEAWLSQSNYEAALVHASAAVSLQPTNMNYLHQLGTVRYLAGDDAGAAEAFHALLLTQPNNADAIYNLAMIRYGQERFAEAETGFARFVQFDARNAEAWNNRGVCFFRLGRNDEAVQCFRQALAIEPGNDDAKYNLQAVGQR